MTTSPNVFLPKFSDPRDIDEFVEVGHDRFVDAESDPAGAVETEIAHVVALLQLGAFGAKVVLLSSFQLLVRWTLPRFRADQLMNLGWKLLLPMSLANIMVTALIKLISFL